MPLSFYKAVEETVRETLHQGLYGWQVTDCMVTMTHSGYLGSPAGRSMSPRDFRNLTPLVLMCALQQAGTVVCEPIHRFHLEIPARHARTDRCPCWHASHAVPHTPEFAARRACSRVRSRRRGCTSCSSSSRR